MTVSGATHQESVIGRQYKCWQYNNQLLNYYYYDSFDSCVLVCVTGTHTSIYE